MRAAPLIVATLASLVGEPFDARATNGAYASLAARDAAACARMCADDGLCIAWSYGADGLCELRATTPTAPAGVAHGVSAPAGQRWEPPPAQELVAATGPAIEQAAPSQVEDDDVSRLLLGGLDLDDGGLRD